MTKEKVKRKKGGAHGSKHLADLEAAATPSGSGLLEGGPVVSAAGRPQPPANGLSSLRDEEEAAADSGMGAGLAVGSRGATGLEGLRDRSGDSNVTAPRARRSRATIEGADAQAEPVVGMAGAPPRRSRSEAAKAYWREVKAGRRVRVEQPHDPPRGPDFNPLFTLPEEFRAKLFVFLRDCPYNDAARVLLRDQKMDDVTDAQITEFHQAEAYDHWLMRTTRAADEADALIRLAENSVPKFSAGILSALGQEAFRQVVSEKADPAALAKLTTLFMKARSDERTDQMQELKREQVRHDLQGQVEHALEKLAEEVERHPAAREAFAALRRELAAGAEEDE